MSDNPQFQNKYRIASSRLAGWNYSSPGYYFVTLCTKNRATSLGSVENSEIVLSAIGKIAQEYWQAIPLHCPNAEIDEYIIMPNHVHGMIILKLPEYTTEKLHPNPNRSDMDLHMSSISPKTGSLSAIIRSYKSAVTHCAHQNGYPEFAWQSRFYDHIIRDDHALQTARQYIQNNPLKWELEKHKLENLWM